MTSLQGQLLIAAPQLGDGNFFRSVVLMVKHDEDGALGLILPGLTGIRPGLTPLAAAGLVSIMAGATVVTLAMGGPAALIPAVVGLLAALVAYGRWRVAPHPGRTGATARSAALPGARGANESTR